MIWSYNEDNQGLAWDCLASYSKQIMLPSSSNLRRKYKAACLLYLCFQDLDKDYCVDMESKFLHMNSSKHTVVLYPFFHITSMFRAKITQSLLHFNGNKL